MTATTTPSTEERMPTPRLSDQRGIALAMAMFALVVVGALVAGTFFAGRLERQSGQSTVLAVEAAEAAEAGLASVYASWNPFVYDTLAPGAKLTLATGSLGGGAYYDRTVTRLNGNLFLVEAEGQRRDAQGNVVSRRRLGYLLRQNKGNVNMRAGLTTVGVINMLGNSFVTGKDSVPAAWRAAGLDCPDTNSTTGILYNGTLLSKGSSSVQGDPPSTLDPTLSPSNLLTGATFSELTSLKTVTIPEHVTLLNGVAPQTTGSPATCVTGSSAYTNWGDPANPSGPCGSYFPVIYHKGDLTITGNNGGQGILLVEGNLTVHGNINFYGPVIVTGTVDIKGTGGPGSAKFYGGIIAQNINLDTNILNGNAHIQYSSCAVARALQGSATVSPLAGRSWAQLY